MTQQAKPMAGTRTGGCRGRVAASWTRLALASMLGAMLLAAACDTKECTRSSDCPAGQYCSAGQCLPFPDGGADADADADVPAESPTEDVEADGTVVDGDEDDAGGADADGTEAEEDGEGPCIVDTDCDDGSACTDDQCVAGECRWTKHPDGELCPDDEWCDGVEECFDGLCRNTVTPCPEPTDLCIYAVCHEDTHTCSDAPVIDGVMCGGETGCGPIDVCVGGLCTRRLEGACEDGNPCTVDRCVEEPPGAPPHCERDYMPDGTTCTTPDPCGGTGARVCVVGECISAADAPCSDGSLCTSTACTGDGSCEAATPTPALPVVACGSGVSASTLTGPNDVTSYGTCATGLTGGEAVYAVDVPAETVQLAVTLSDVTSNGSPSVLVLRDACDAASCIAGSGGSLGVTAAVTGGRRYYMVIDGAANARATFSMSVDCR